MGYLIPVLADNLCGLIQIYRMVRLPSFIIFTLFSCGIIKCEIKTVYF